MGAQLLTGHTDHNAKLWDTATGRVVHAFKGRTEEVRSLTLSSDGRQLLIGCGYHLAILWDAVAGGQIRSFPMESRMLRDGECSISPDGRQVLTISKNRTAILWDAGAGQKIREFQGQTRVEVLSFSPDGRHLITGGLDGSAILWDSSTGQKFAQFRRAGRPGIDRVQPGWSPDSHRFLGSSRDSLGCRDRPEDPLLSGCTGDTERRTPESRRREAPTVGGSSRARGPK